MRKSPQAWIRREDYRDPQAERPAYIRPTDELPKQAPSPPPPGMLERLEIAAAIGDGKKHSPASVRAYEGDFRLFEAWCARCHVGALPASVDAVMEFLAQEAERGAKASTINRRIAAIRWAHKLVDQPSPTDDERVRAIAKGSRYILGQSQKRVGFEPEEITAIIRDARRRKNTIGTRDYALLTLAYASGLRRAELVALDWENIGHGETVIYIVRSGMDDIIIRQKTIDCPVEALKLWHTPGDVTGPVFRSIKKGGKLGARLSAQSVADIIKAHAKNVGLDATRYAADSLRLGAMAPIGPSGG